MTIIENSILHLSTLLFFLLGLGGLLLGYLKRNHLIYYRSFGAIILGCLQSLFIAKVNGDLFILSSKADFEANFIFTTSTAMIAFIAVWAMIVFYLHKIVPTILVQLGLALSTIIVVVTFSTTASHKLHKRFAKKNEPTRFLKSDQFQKGDPNPAFSKLPSPTDSVRKQ